MIGEFRDGQWVRWEGSIPGAHKCKDGKIVGIYHSGGTDPFGHPKPEAIYPIGEDGLGIEVGRVTLTVSPNQPGLEPLLSKEDMPPGRVVHPHWTPRP